MHYVRVTTEIIRQRLKPIFISPDSNMRKVSRSPSDGRMIHLIIYVI